MSNKKGLVVAAATSCCPRCREGKMFDYPVYDITKLGVMRERCSVCNLKFELEPGFFVGAMYVGYAISVATFVTICTALFILFDKPSLSLLLTSSIAGIILMVPVNFRYSRVLMLYWFGGDQVAYNPDFNIK